MVYATAQRDSKSSSEETLRMKKKYKLAVIEILEKIRSGFHWISKIDLNKQADDWVEVLMFAELPLEKLNEAYLSATTNTERREVSMPITHTEILQAYRKKHTIETDLSRVNSCDFCRGHKENPATYPPCTFHSTTTHKTVDLKLQQTRYNATLRE